MFFPLSKNTKMEKPTLTNEEKFTQKFLRSHAKEKNFKETRKKVRLIKVKRYKEWRTIIKKKVK